MACLYKLRGLVRRDGNHRDSGDQTILDFRKHAQTEVAARRAALEQAWAQGLVVSQLETISVEKR